MSSFTLIAFLNVKFVQVALTNSNLMCQALDAEQPGVSRYLDSRFDIYNCTTLVSDSALYVHTAAQLNLQHNILLEPIVITAVIGPEAAQW